MKSLSLLYLSALTLVFSACGDPAASPAEAGVQVPTTPAAGQSAVKDDVSQKNIVGVAVSSPDHTTLVAAVQQAEYVDVLSNAGPFTVFAPTNAAFAALPAGTVDDLMKPENKMKLRDILEYHVSLGVYKAESLMDGQSIGQANSQNIKITMKDGKPTVNGANILASIPASNGIIHVIDAVLLPPK